MTTNLTAHENSSANQVTPALEVRNLVVNIGSGSEARLVLDDVSLRVMPGQSLGIVGESGSGKSMTALAVMGLLPSTAHVTGGEVLVNGKDLLRMKPRQRRSIRGGGVSMILQDPVTALDPSFTVGFQLAQSLRLHRGLKGDALRQESLDLLDKVRIPSGADRLNQYPHELSGGMRQRVCSAIALAGEPKLLIADEPTTALDVTTQAQYLEMLEELQTSRQFALVLITHDLGIVRQVCQNLLVMYAGQVVEEASPVRSVVEHPQNPYTKGLFDSLPTLDPDADLRPIEGQMPEPEALPQGCRFAPRCTFARAVCTQAVPSLRTRPGEHRRSRCFGTEDGGWVEVSDLYRRVEHQDQGVDPETETGLTRLPKPTGNPLVEITDLRVHFHIGKGVLKRRGTDRVKAIDGVGVAFDEGSTLGVVGESGSGKSTLAHVLIRLIVPTSGQVSVAGIDLQRGRKKQIRRYKDTVQIVFQDPFSSLDPRMTVKSIVGEPLTASLGIRRPADLRERVGKLLEMVHLPANSMWKYPHQFSGGQRQRIAIARAVATNPRLLVLDEPTSALDVSIRAQILRLLKDLQAEIGLSYVIISHDLSTVAQMATKVAVMYLGRIVELGTATEVFRSPAHPYTQALLSSVPNEDDVRPPMLADDYEIPSPIHLPEGCRFKHGCLLRRQLGNPSECDTIDPPMEFAGSGQQTACHFPEKALEFGAHLHK